MKPHSIALHVAVSVFLICEARGQASFDFSNYNPPSVDAPVFDAQGTPLAGPDYEAELWGRAMADSLTPALVYGEGTREIVSFYPPPYAGYFVSTSGFLSVLSVPPYGWAWLQVRAWDARLGSTYEDVAALGIGGYGESLVFYAQGGDPTLLLPALPPPLIGLESFSLRPIVPEPSALWLLLPGLPLLFWRKLFPR